jgi:hypothetical protein
MAKFMGMNLEKPPTNRPWFKRFSIVGGLTVTGMMYLESVGVLDAGTTAELKKVAVEALTTVGGVTELIKHAGAFVTGLGVYRHIVK